MKNGLIEKMCADNKALSEPIRVKMIKHICSADEEYTVSVSDIAEVFGISQPTASKHLGILCRCGFLNRKRIGASVCFSLNQKTLQDYKCLLDTAFGKIAGGRYNKCPYNYNCDECPISDKCI